MGGELLEWNLVLWTRRKALGENNSVSDMSFLSFAFALTPTLPHPPKPGYQGVPPADILIFSHWWLPTGSEFRGKSSVLCEIILRAATLHSMEGQFWGWHYKWVGTWVLVYFTTNKLSAVMQIDHLLFLGFRLPNCNESIGLYKLPNTFHLRLWKILNANSLVIEKMEHMTFMRHHGVKLGLLSGLRETDFGSI